jgi:DNA (cytosine-5)-methyltransferase 1
MHGSGAAFQGEGSVIAYYNEIEPYAAEWLRNLIKQGLIADGKVDERSIVDVQPDDLRGFTQCHFFAGIGGWSYGARLAGWPDDRPLWTGSCPCQPFSVAGKGKGQKDERHLWPEFHRLIAACRPDVVMGEQVAAAVGKDWLDGVFTDLEGIGYACGAAVVPACAVDAPHRRDRLWFVADTQGGNGRTGLRETGQERDGYQSGDSGGRREGRPEPELRSGRATVARPGASCGDVGHAIGARLEGQSRHGDDGRGPGRLDAVEAGSVAEASGGHWADASWIIGHDGKARRVEPGIRLLAHGVSARVGKLRAAGNAIVPQVAAEVIAAFMECRP